MRVGDAFCIPSSFLFLPFGTYCILPIYFRLPLDDLFSSFIKFACAKYHTFCHHLFF